MEQNLLFLFLEKLTNKNKKYLKGKELKSYSSFSSINFKSANETKTNFIPSLVLFSLCQSGIFAKEVQNLKRKAVEILLKNKSKNGIWNYFINRKDYADDLDDTSLAYLALHSYNKKLFLIKDVHKFVLALIKCEVKEGGPYTTWINPNYPKEVDIAVNANIARALEVHGIVLPSLSKLIDQSIKNKKLKSIYYTFPLFTCYFLSHLKNLNPKQKEKIIKYIISLRKGKLWSNLLESSLAANVLINLNVSFNLISSVLRNLELHLKRIKYQIPHEAICLDPAEGEKQKYLGANIWTKALLLETRKFHHQYLLDEFKNICKNLDYDIEPFTKCLIQQFTELPFAFHDSLKKKVLGEEELTKLTANYLFGILAYDLFDNIYDNAKDTNYLPLGLDLLHQMAERLQAQGFDRKIIYRFIYATNLGMKQEKLNVKKDFLYPGRKSIGSALPCFLLLSKLGITEKHSDWKNLYKFFLHYLTVRALNDDMVDYKKDLKNNHPNCVADLIKKHGQKNLPKIVNQNIKKHLVAGKKHLAGVKILEPNSYLEHLLNKISL